MKRISQIIILMFLMVSGVSGQIVDDALRYSQIFYNGTARFTAMGGAFTALGGDMSTLSQNPAGLGIFRSSEITFSPQLLHITNSSSFNGISKDYLYNFNLGQAGIVSSLILNKAETGLISLNFGYSFNKTNNLNSSVMIQGISTTSSMADYWADISYGLYKDELLPDAFLAYDTWIIDTLPGSNTEYGTIYSNYGDNPPSVYQQNIRRIITDEGYTGEHAISIGGNYSNKFYFGATLGINRLNYTSHYEHLETANGSMPSEFQNFTYTQHYKNTGTGFVFKIGTILKPVETVRIGLAFHSPTIYKIYEICYDNMSSNFEGNDHYESKNTPLEFEYTLTTPFRALAGVAVQIKKLALLSLDYEFVDYSTARFSGSGDNDYDYGEENLEIKDVLKSTGNLRMGGELRMNKFYLRSGYGYYGKVFETGSENDNLRYNSISFGGGFREQNLSIDIGYTHYANRQKYILYETFSETAISKLTTGRNIFTVTVGYKFGY